MAGAPYSLHTNTGATQYLCSVLNHMGKKKLQPDPLRRTPPPPVSSYASEVVSTQEIPYRNSVIPSVFMHTLSLYSHLTKGLTQFPVRTVHLLQTLECTNSCSQIHCYEFTGGYSFLCAMQVLLQVTSKLVLLHKSSLMKQIQPVPQKTKAKQAKQHKQVFKKAE